MKALLDTNILVHSHNRSSPHQEKASNLVRKAVKGKIGAYLAPQILYEFFSVITNPKKVEKSLSPSRATEICLDLWECPKIKKVTSDAGVLKETLRLAAEQGISRAKIFDCRIAVTAKKNDLDKIYTENTQDFDQYKFLKAENPFA